MIPTNDWWRFGIRPVQGHSHSMLKRLSDAWVLCTQEFQITSLILSYNFKGMGRSTILIDLLSLWRDKLQIINSDSNIIFFFLEDCSPLDNYVTLRSWIIQTVRQAQLFHHQLLKAIWTDDWSLSQPSFCPMTLS